MAHADTTSGGNELGDFLRSRRAALDPQQAGMPDDGRLRRVPGLRREELAQLAHISVDYIVRLEQGRTRRVSRPVLDGLADALRLAPDERDYLFTVAEVAPAAPPRQPGRPGVAPQLRQLLDTMHDVPAMVLRRAMDVLAWNRGAAALLTDFGALPPAERNLIRLTFLDEDFRALYADWPRAARECIAVLRMEAGRNPHDQALSALSIDSNNHRRETPRPLPEHREQRRASPASITFTLWSSAPAENSLGVNHSGIWRFHCNGYEPPDSSDAEPDQGALPGEIEPNTVGRVPCGRLRRPVGAVAGRCEPRQRGQHVHDGAAAVRCEHRCERADHSAFPRSATSRRAVGIAPRHARDHIHLVATLARQDGRRPNLRDN